MQTRIKSIVMWIGIVLSAFIAIGGQPDTLISWSAFGGAILNLISNPFLLVSFAYTIFAIVNNPTNNNGF